MKVRCTTRGRLDVYPWGIDARLPWLDVARWAHEPKRARAFAFDAHWALYGENHLQGLHIPFLRPGLTQTLDLDGYRYEQGRWCNLQLATARADEPAFEPPSSRRRGRPGTASASLPTAGGCSPN